MLLSKIIVVITTSLLVTSATLDVFWWLVGWFVGWLVCLLVCLLVGWFIGWLVCQQDYTKLGKRLGLCPTLTFSVDPEKGMNPGFHSLSVRLIDYFTFALISQAITHGSWFLFFLMAYLGSWYLWESKTCWAPNTNTNVDLNMFSSREVFFLAEGGDTPHILWPFSSPISWSDNLSLFFVFSCLLQYVCSNMFPDPRSFFPPQSNFCMSWFAYGVSDK